MNNQIHIPAGFLFPWHFILAGGCLVVLAIAFLSSNLILAVLLFFVGAAMISARTGTSILLDPKHYREYHSVFLIKFGKWFSYDHVEKVYMNASRVSRAMHSVHTSTGSIFTDTEFNGYIKFSDGTKVHLCSTKDKSALMTQLRAIAIQLRAPFVDVTELAVE